MAKYFRNRCAREIRAFLEAHNYKKTITRGGDDDIYECPGKKFPIKIPSRDNEVIPIGTMDYIKHLIGKNGLNRKYILQWWENNGFGE